MLKATKAATKKAATKKAATKKAEPEATPTPLDCITIRELQGAAPCESEYYTLLKDLGGRPIKPNHYHAFPGRYKARVGPDDPIPLLRLLDLPSSSMQLDGAGRISWIIGNIERFRPIQAKISSIMREYHDAGAMTVLTRTAILMVMFEKYVRGEP